MIFPPPFVPTLQEVGIRSGGSISPIQSVAAGYSSPATPNEYIRGPSAVNAPIGMACPV